MFQHQGTCGTPYDTTHGGPAINGERVNTANGPGTVVGGAVVR